MPQNRVVACGLASTRRHRLIFASQNRILACGLASTTHSFRVHKCHRSIWSSLQKTSHIPPFRAPKSPCSMRISSRRRHCAVFPSAEISFCHADWPHEASSCTLSVPQHRIVACGLASTRYHFLHSFRAHKSHRSIWMCLHTT